MCEYSLSVVLPEGEDDGAAELPVRVPQQPLQFLLDGETHQVLPRQDTLHLTCGVRQILITDATFRTEVLFARTFQREFCSVPFVPSSSPLSSININISI